MENPRLSEEALAKRCAQGERKAQHLLYQYYGGNMWAICLRYLADSTDAEDVMQEGFLKIFDRISQFSFRGEGSLRAWMSKVMVNEALTFLKKRMQRQANETTVTVIPEQEDEPDDWEGWTEDALMALIGELPDGYRTVFNLVVFEQKSHKEIADLLGINEKTSSSQYYRARMLLIKKIKEKQRHV